MEGKFQLGRWLIEPNLNSVSSNGNTVQLEPKVMTVLVCLAQRAGEPVSKEELLKAVWPDTFVGESVLTRSISELRRAFEDEAKEPRVIQTIAKRGYRLLAPVTPVAAHATQLSQAPSSIPRQNSTHTGARYRSWCFRVLACTGGVVLLFALVAALNVGDVRAHLMHTTSAPVIKSVAVLPLKNLSGDPGQEYFADGMTDELITYLSQAHGLRVISYTSVYSYKNTKKTLPEVARELAVDAVVEGSVQHVGDRVRVNAQLVYAPQEGHLWAQSYDRAFQDALGLQSTLASAIAAQVKARLSPQQETQLHNPNPVNLKALEDYLQGDYHLAKVGDRFSEGEARTAIAYFQDAIREDPIFAAAYVKICQVYETQAVLFSKAERWPAEKAAAEKALSLDPNLPKAHVAVGTVKLLYDWDFPGARAEFERALELAPNTVEAHDLLGDFLEITNHPSEGMREHERAQELDPGNDHLTPSFYREREYEHGIELVKKRLDVRPQDGGALWCLFNLYAQKGMKREAVDMFQQTATVFGYDDAGRAVSRTYSLSGYRAALEEVAKQMAHYYTLGQLDRPVAIAVQYARLGNKEQALHWLQAAYRDHDADLVYAFPEEQWDFMRSEPRFQELIRKIGVPQ